MEWKGNSNYNLEGSKNQGRIYSNYKIENEKKKGQRAWTDGKLAGFTYLNTGETGHSIWRGKNS